LHFSPLKKSQIIAKKHILAGKILKFICFKIYALKKHKF